jgi:pimeloyl-ACP methyl ester carboxylesterase
MTKNKSGSISGSKNRIKFFNSIIFAAIVILLIQVIPGTLSAQTNGYAPVNGLNIYNEIHGEGKPVILLHGAYMTINLNWNEIIPELSKSRKVIAVEIQGHGRTVDIDRPFSYEELADDLAELCKHLQIEKTDVIGYSFGGTVALQFAIKYPALLNRMVITSTTYKYEGWLPEVRQMLASFNPDFFDATPLKPEYERIAPYPGHWKDFVAKFIEFDKQDFNLGEENMKSIKSPVLFIMGDNDGVDKSHVANMYELTGGNIFGDVAGLPKSQLAILPGTTHVSLMMETNKLIELINPFLNK